MLINSQNLANAFVSFSAKFNGAFNSTTSHHETIAMMVKSGTREERYGWLGKVPALREWIGERIIQNLESHDYAIKNRKFELTIEISRDDYEDDQYGIFSPFIEEMGLNAKQHPDTLLFDLLRAGFTTGLGYDGQPFFDTDHPVIDIDGQTVSVSNVQAGAEDPWFLLDTSRIIKPFVFQERVPYTFQRMDRENNENVFFNDTFIYGIRARVNVGYGLWQLAFGSQDVLNKTNYAAARKEMMRFKGDNGAPLNVRPTTLVVGPGNEEAAMSILNSEHDAAGATNVWKDTAELIVATQLD